MTNLSSCWLLFTLVWNPLQAKNDSYHFIVCDYKTSRLSEYSKHGELLWDYKPDGVIFDFDIFPNGNLAIPLFSPKPTKVLSINRAKDVLWTYRPQAKEVINVTMTHAGELIIGEQDPPQAVRLSAKGERISHLSMPTTYKSHHGQLGNVYELGNGNLLAQHWGEGVVREYDRDGTIVWEYFPKGHVIKGAVADVIRLKNGVTIIACGYLKKVIAVDRDKKLLWEFGERQAPELNLLYLSAIQLLENGHLIVTNMVRGGEGKGAHAFELSKDQKVLWKLTDHKRIGYASKVWVVE